MRTGCRGHHSLIGLPAAASMEHNTHTKRAIIIYFIFNATLRPFKNLSYATGISLYISFYRSLEYDLWPCEKGLGKKCEAGVVFQKVYSDCIGMTRL